MSKGQILSLTGNDTLMLWKRLFNDLADDSVIEIDFPNDLVTVKTGKNKNTIYAKDEQGNNATLVLRVMRGSSDDKFLNDKLLSMNNDFPSFITATGTFTKRMGSGDGTYISDTYTFKGGVFTKLIPVQDNVSGDTNQSVSIYNLKFAIATRGLG